MKVNELFTRKNWLLLKAMVSTDFKLRYQQSILGYLWSVLKPLMLFAIMYLVFVRFLRFGARLAGSQVIGYVGTTGNSTGNHLHFEVWQNGERTDALGYFKAKE